MAKIPMFESQLDTMSPSRMFHFLVKAGKKELGKLGKKGKFDLKWRMRKAVQEYKERTGKMIKDFPKMLKSIYSEVKENLTPKSALGTTLNIGALLLLYPEDTGAILDLVRMGVAIPLFLEGVHLVQKHAGLRGPEEMKKKKAKKKARRIV